jgi:cytochrome c
VLVGGQGTLATQQPVLTIGSFWPYATTVFDYIRRAMPFNAPGSLNDAQVYALTAFLLAANGVVPQDTVLDKARLAALRMPNRDGFTPD